MNDDFDPTKTVTMLLANHEAYDLQESDDIALIRTFVSRHKDCFGKGNPEGHITGSAFILDGQNRILMTFHRKLERWLQLGGHSSAQETNPADTALREAREESGLKDVKFHPIFGEKPFDIDRHMIPARGDEMEHAHLDFRYVFITQSPSDIICSEESRDLRWFERSQLEDMSFDSALMRAFTKIWTALA